MHWGACHQHSSSRSRLALRCLTPLSTQLPAGTQQLSISKQGYATEQAFLQLDPAPAGAKAVRTRVVLREEAPAAVAEPVARARPAAPARPPARKAAPVRRAEAAREEAAAAVEAAPEPPAKPEPAPSAPLVEERSRVKLVDGQSRARLLE